MSIARLAVTGPLVTWLALADCAAPPRPSNTVSPSSRAIAVSPVDAELRAALAGPARTAEETARDTFRHPRETLEFFGLRDDQSVIEIMPGRGWYTAILAPVLRDHGKLSIAGWRSQAPLDRFQKMPAVFDKVQLVDLDDDPDWTLGPPESADLVVTFRNLHNPVGDWWGEGATGKMLSGMFRVLKHGAVLGLVDHRARAGAPTDARTVHDTGYLPQDFVVKLVEGAGFKLLAESEVNANPKDTTDHPKGVWTLPPSYALGETDRAKYAAIGESDRMTLEFVKP